MNGEPRENPGTKTGASSKTGIFGGVLVLALLAGVIGYKYWAERQPIDAGFMQALNLWAEESPAARVALNGYLASQPTGQVIAKDLPDLLDYMRRVDPDGYRRYLGRLRAMSR
jgi:hypothetical protein